METTQYRGLFAIIYCSCFSSASDTFTPSHDWEFWRAIYFMCKRFQFDNYKDTNLGSQIIGSDENKTHVIKGWDLSKLKSVWNLILIILAHKEKSIDVGVGVWSGKVVYLIFDNLYFDFD